MRKYLDRSLIKMKSLEQRPSRIKFPRDMVESSDTLGEISTHEGLLLEELIQRIISAREKGNPVILVFGAHTIKNGLGPVLAELAGGGWVTHLATNGAGIIHDWEFAYQGASSESVLENTARGEFGNWEETLWWINMAINIGAWKGYGYGESVGRMILDDGLDLPDKRELQNALAGSTEGYGTMAAASDLLHVYEKLGLSGGRRDAGHLNAGWSLQAEATRLGVPFTAHPMIGHDIIYNHPANCGAAVGRTAERDFLCYAEAVSRIEEGVYISVGSAVMSPMIFEKSMSMAQNLAHQQGRKIENHYIFAADLAASSWDWSKGEPPENNPDYYLRYNKSFSRMGGSLRYLSMDNRRFLPALCTLLARQDKGIPED
jgi:hypothetical protein